MKGRGFLSGVLLATAVWWALVGVITATAPLIFMAIAAAGASMTVFCWGRDEPAPVPEPDVAPSCARCQWWKRSGTIGQCRIGQPWLFDRGEPGIQWLGRWAVTGEDDWCGEFQAKDRVHG
jgi:hypothetical protein